MEQGRLRAAYGYAAYRMTEADVDGLLARAEAGDGMAAKELGDLYLVGIPVLKASPEAALRWYEIAIALGDVSASRGASLARFHIEGHGVLRRGSQALEKAREILEGKRAYTEADEAALQALALADMPEAQLLLGLLYADTENPAFDVGLALPHLQSADRNGSARAAFKLGELLQQASPHQAAAAFLRAAERGLPQAAQRVAAAFHLDTIPIPAGHGLKWLDVAATHGDATAAALLEEYRKAHPGLVLEASIDAARWRSRRPSPPSWDR